jgi:hypothetical protein
MHALSHTKSVTPTTSTCPGFAANLLLQATKTKCALQHSTTVGVLESLLRSPSHTSNPDSSYRTVLSPISLQHHSFPCNDRNNSLFYLGLSFSIFLFLSLIPPSSRSDAPPLRLPYARSSSLPAFPSTTSTLGPRQYREVEDV